MGERNPSAIADRERKVTFERDVQLAWLAGIFLLLPGLRFLSFTALYGVYLLTKGLPVVMKSPAESAKRYATAVTVFAAALIFLTAFAQSVLFSQWHA